MRFAKLTSSVVNFQVHASEDSHYAILPIYENTSRIVGWSIYDTITGKIKGEFDTLTDAREWVNDLIETKTIKTAS